MLSCFVIVVNNVVVIIKLEMRHLDGDSRKTKIQESHFKKQDFEKYFLTWTIQLTWGKSRPLEATSCNVEKKLNQIGGYRIFPQPRP